jgi:hypothetical protein
MKMLDKIDIDKTEEGVEEIRKQNNSRAELNSPKKNTEKGFCTKCLIF